MNQIIRRLGTFCVVSSLAVFMVPFTQADVPLQGSVVLKVMTYNIHGLPWPVNPDRKLLDRIGLELKKSRALGIGPDLVFIQEAFTKTARNKILQADYPHVLYGPGQSTVNPGTKIKRVGKGPPKKGRGHLVNSGLIILSEYRLEPVALRVYSFMKSGMDIFSNKGFVHALLHKPETPPIHVINTHLQAGTSKRANKNRIKQIQFLNQYIRDNIPVNAPIIFGGDFNFRRVPGEEGEKGYDFFSETAQFINSSDICLEYEKRCNQPDAFYETQPRVLREEIELGHLPDRNFWLSTLDHVFYSDRRDQVVQLRPVLGGVKFDRAFEEYLATRTKVEELRGKMLSDHVAVWTSMEMSW